MEANFYKRKNAWENVSRAKVFDFCDGYKEFLNAGRTEREAFSYVLSMAETEGFENLLEKEALRPGDKVYAINRKKGIMLAVIGRQPLCRGFSVVGAHIDSPRLDVKQNPLFDDAGLALLKTHYYGGIKKYQWMAMPLALSGVAVKRDGTVVDVLMGTDEDEFCLTITDLLPHLASEQMKKPMSQGIEGEDLNVLIGGIPEFENGEAKLKSAVTKLILEKYNIEEEDFLRAELEVIPAYPAKDVGVDRAFVGGYGQDDRVCAYCALQAVFDAGVPERTSVCLLVDKEEVGSMGVTGMQSRFFENMIGEMIERQSGYSGLKVRRALSNALCLSADVCAALDPTFSSVYEKQNTPVAGSGVAIVKYTGARGKSGASDASAELVARVTNTLEQSGVIWQTGELGKVDAGGGGTIAQYTANLDMDTIDIGVPLLSMHSPFEVASKADIYQTYLAYRTFLTEGE